MPDPTPPQAPLDQETAREFLTKYMKYYRDGTFDKNRDKLHEAQALAKELGIQYGSKLMPKFVSQKMQTALANAQGELTASGLPIPTRPGVPQVPVPEPSTSAKVGAKAVDVAGKLAAGLSPAAILLMYPGDQEVRKQLFGYNAAGKIGLYTPPGITPKGERGVPPSGGQPGLLSTGAAGVGLGINRAIPAATGTLAGLATGGGIPAAVAGLVGGATGGYVGDPLEYFLNDQDRGMLQTAKAASAYHKPLQNFLGGAGVDVATFGSNPIKGVGNLVKGAKLAGTFIRGARAAAPAVEAGAEAVAPTLAGRAGAAIARSRPGQAMIRGAAAVGQLPAETQGGAASAIMSMMPPASYVSGQLGSGQPIDPKMLAAQALLGLGTQGGGIPGPSAAIRGLAAGRNIFGRNGPTSIMGGTGDFVPPPAPPGQASPILPPEPTYVGGVHRPSVQYHPVTGQPIVGQPVHPVTGAPASPLESVPTPIPRPGQPLGEPHPLTGPTIEESLGNYYGNPSVSPLNLQPQPAPTPYNPLLPQEFQTNAAGVPQPNAEFPYTGIAPQGTPPTPPSGPAGIETVRPTPAVSTATPTPSGIEPVRPLPPPEPAPVQAKRGRPTKPVEQNAPVPTRGQQVETPNGVGTYTSKGTDNGKKDGKPVIWVMHPGDEKSTMYPVGDVNVVGTIAKKQAIEAEIRKQAGVGDYDPNDPTTFGPKTPKQAQDVVDLLSGVKPADLNPTQQQHLKDAQAILAQETIINAAQHKLQEGSGGAEHQGGKGSGKETKPSGSNRTVSTTQGVQPVAPVQPRQGTTPVAPVAAQGTTPATNAAPVAPTTTTATAPVVATAPAAPVAKGSVKAKTTVIAPATTGKVVQTASAEAGRVPETAPAGGSKPTAANTLTPEPSEPGVTTYPPQYVMPDTAVATTYKGNAGGWVTAWHDPVTGHTQSIGSSMGFTNEADALRNAERRVAASKKATTTEQAPTPINGNPPEKTTPSKLSWRYDRFGKFHEANDPVLGKVSIAKLGYAGGKYFVNRQNFHGEDPMFKNGYDSVEEAKNAVAEASQKAPTPINGNPPAATVPAAATPTAAETKQYNAAKSYLDSVPSMSKEDQSTASQTIDALKQRVSDYETKYGTAPDSTVPSATPAPAAKPVKSAKGKAPAIVPGSEDHAAALLRMSDSIKPQIAKSKNPNAVSETNQAVQDAIAAWDKDPNDAAARTNLTKALQKHGVDPEAAGKFSSELQGFLRSSRPNLGASLFGGSNITSAITRFRGSRAVQRKFAETPTTDPLLIDANTPKWNAADLVNLPQSVTSPTGIVHQEGGIERDLGPKGAQASQIMVKTSRDIDVQKLEAKQRLDQVHAFLEAGRRKLGGSRLDSAATKARFNASFTKYIEMTPAERAAQDATGKVPPEIQTAVKEYDKYTDWMKQQLYDYQKNILKRENMPDIKDWGISDAGYFHHSMFKDFTANMKDAAGNDYPLSADTYGELLHNIEQHQKAFGTTLDKVSGRENRVYDPTVRLNQGKFWKLVEDVSKSPGVDANGRRILSRDDVLGDMTGKIGMKSSKSEFISSLMKRAGAEGYENEAWRYIMNRYSDNAIEGINITKMRRQLQPLAEEIGRTDSLGQKYLESKMDMVAGKPTDSELKQANFIHTLEVKLGIPGYSPNPMRSLRNLASAIQGTTFYATLGTRPAATLSNELQRYTTLFPRIGAKAMARAEVAAVAPKNVEMMRDLGILDGEYRVVNNNGTLQAVLVGKSKLRLANPVEAFRNASQRNRAVGFMHGYNSIMDAMNAGQLKPDGTKFTREDAISEGHNFATITEFKNNNFYTPDILKTPAGGIAFQYQGYTINNLKQWKDAAVRLYSPSLRAKGGITKGEAWAQAGRKVGGQIAVGGAHSIAPIFFTAGTYFWLKDHGFPEPLAKAVAFGAPATAGVDMSGMTAPIPDVLGNAAPAVQMLGPGVSSAVRLGQGAYQDYSKGTFPEQTLRAVPVARQANAAYSILTGKPIYYSIRGMKDGELTKLTDKLIVLAGGLPFEETLSRAEAEEKLNRKHPGPSLDNLIRTAPKPLVPASPSGTPSPPR